jgi:hypothetical protein
VIELSGLRRPTDTTAVVTIHTHGFPETFENSHYGQGDELHLARRNGRWLIARVRRLSET